MNLTPPHQFWYAIAGQRDFKVVLSDKLTFPSSIKARNLKKGDNDGDQNVRGSQVLTLKLAWGGGGDTVRLRGMHFPEAATVAFTAQGKDSPFPGSRVRAGLEMVG